jgi:polyphosphate kinase
VRVPDGDGEAGVLYISIARLIQRYAEALFPGFTIQGDGLFRVLRDSDIEIEEEAEDLVRTFRTAIQRRRRGQVIHAGTRGGFRSRGRGLLREQLGINDQRAVIKTDGMIGIDGLAEIVREDRPDLKFEPIPRAIPSASANMTAIAFAAIREKDIIIHHPYESFEVVVDFLRQAAADPDVVAIKQTLYRAGKQSAVIAR